MYALVDCNNFYASVERVFAPSLIGKPIIVLSNNDGCVISRSNEAKAAGVKMGAPFHELHDLIIHEKINVFSSNYPLLGDMSSRVMDMLSTFTPDIEVYSIDEAFLKFNGFDAFFNFQNIGEQIHNQVKKGVGIPVSIGFAPTKSLSKVANKFAKKYPKLGNNVCVLDTPEKIEKALRKTAIGDVWGIGRRISKKLIAINVVTAYDFTKLNTDYVKTEFGVVGVRLQRDLKGLPTIGAEEIKPKKVIANTRSFEKMMSTKQELKERITTFAVTCAESLRKQKSNTSLIGVFLQTNSFRKDLPQYNPYLAIATDFPTSSSIEINKFAQKALDIIWRERYQYKKAGVMVMGISQDDTEQLNLFVAANPKHKLLMKTMDQIHSKMGKDKVVFGIQNFEKRKKWKMRQNYLSPCYTTQMSDLPKLICK